MPWRRARNEGLASNLYLEREVVRNCRPPPDHGAQLCLGLCFCPTNKPETSCRVLTAKGQPGLGCLVRGIQSKPTARRAARHGGRLPPPCSSICYLQPAPRRERTTLLLLLPELPPLSHS